MKTTPEIATLAHELLMDDLLASETYLLYGLLLRDWGYQRLAERFDHESLHERQHATLQIERLTYLDVPIDLSQRPTPAPTPTTPRGCIDASLAMEEAVAAKLRTLIARCREHDEGTRLLAETLLEETEMDHILWLRSQLDQIEQVGEARYLAHQIRPAGAQAG